jgi:hypothetical protein
MKERNITKETYVYLFMHLFILRDLLVFYDAISISDYTLSNDSMIGG